MGDWKDQLKKIGAATGKVIVNGVQAVADETKRRSQTVSWKNQIMDVMYLGTIKNLAYEKRLNPQNLIYDKPTLDDYRQAIIMNVSLDELIKYCQRKNIPIRHITDKIDKVKAEREYSEATKNGDVDEKVKEVADFIMKFKSSQDYYFELPYQAELVGWLKTKFPEAVIEKQRGSSRPDIVIAGIAIEVKGPTREQDLQMIANKCLRYPVYYGQGIIIVLFNV